MVFTMAGGGFARCYVIAEEEGLLVVDVGSIGQAEDVVRFISRQLGRSLEQIKYIIATHFHIDHIGGIGHLLQKAGEKTQVIFHQRVGDYMRGSKTLSLQKNWLTGLFPAVLHSARYVGRWGHIRFESLAGIPLPGLRNLVNLPYRAEKIHYLKYGTATRQPLGFGQWDVLETPGHTEDSVSLYHESSAELICGDLILNFKKDGSGYVNSFYCNRDLILKTYRDLCRYIHPERIYPGHGEVISRDGNALLNVIAFH
jgi:glyoxylase-like metal-dependent hydrolase (beta-lactamase superfamily II)